MKKNQLPKVVTGVKFYNEYGGIVADNSCFIIARHQLSRLTRSLSLTGTIEILLNLMESAKNVIF